MRWSGVQCQLTVSTGLPISPRALVGMMSGAVTLKSKAFTFTSFFLAFFSSDIGTIPSTLCPFHQKVEANTILTSYDLERPEGEVIGSKTHTGHRKWPNIRTSYRIGIGISP